MDFVINHNYKTISWLVASNIIKSFAQWGILVILIKFFAAVDVGYFTLGLALSAPIFMLSEMQMKSVLVVEPEDGHDYFKTYLFIRFIATIFAVTTLVVYCVFFRDFNWILIAVILYKAIESLIDILYGYMQKKDDMISMSKIDISKTCLTIIFCLLSTLLLQKIFTTILSIIFVSSLFYFICFVYLKKYLIHKLERFSWIATKDIVKKSFPLGISVLFTSYITNYPRIVIESNCGAEMLAYFGAYSYLAIGVFQVNIPLQTYLRQRLSICFQKNNKQDFMSKIYKTICAFIFLGTVVFLAFYFIGDVIIKIIYEESYIEYKDVIYSLFLSQTFLCLSSVFAIAVLSFNIYSRQAVISFFILTVVVICSSFMINRFGIYGAGYISLIASLLSFVSYATLFYTRYVKWKE